MKQTFVILIALTLLAACAPGPIATPVLAPTTIATPVPMATATMLVPTATAVPMPTKTPIPLTFELLGVPASYNPKMDGWGIQDMQLWHDRIYLAHGAWIKTSYGPIRALYYDFNSEKFIHDENFIFQEEAIEKIQIFNDTLYVPGVDARENPDYYGNLFYKKWDGKWTKLPTIPHGAHIWDVAVLGNLFFASGIDSLQDAGVIWMSADYGQTWKVNFKSAANRTEGTHASFFLLKERLYATIARDGCLMFDNQSWIKKNCMDDRLFIGVYKNALYRNMVVMVPYWNENGNSLEQSLFFFDGQEAWSVKFSLRVTDVVSTSEGLYVLAGTTSGEGSIFRATSLDCHCDKDFTRIVDFDMSKDRPKHPRGNDPISLEYANGRFYVAFADGRLFRSKPYQP